MHRIASSVPVGLDLVSGTPGPLEEVPWGYMNRSEGMAVRTGSSNGLVMLLGQNYLRSRKHFRKPDHHGPCL